MAENSTAAPSRDCNALIEETQPAALRGLDDRAIATLLRDLRAMKAAEPDIAIQKVIAQAIRRAAAEKRDRRGPDVAAPVPAGRSDTPEEKLGKEEREEMKRRKQAERDERKRVKQVEKAEQKAVKVAERERLKAEKQALRVASQPAAKRQKDKAKAKKSGKAEKSQ